MMWFRVKTIFCGLRTCAAAPATTASSIWSVWHLLQKMPHSGTLGWALETQFSKQLMGSLNNQSHLTIHAEYYNMRPQWFWVENESWKSTHVALVKSSCECHLWSKKPRIQGDVLLYPEVVQHQSTRQQSSADLFLAPKILPFLLKLHCRLQCDVVLSILVGRYPKRDKK